MSKKKEKGSQPKTDKKNGNETRKNKGFTTFILFVVLIAGLGWLVYTNGYFGTGKKQNGTMRDEEQVQEFIKENGEMLFSGAEFKVKNTEKEDGIWRSILEIDGQLQDFYITIDGQIILGTETISKILESDKEEVLGKVDQKGLIKIDDTLKKDVKKFIKENLVNGDVEIEVTKVGEEHGLIKIITASQGQEQPLHLTLNGKRLVFGIISIEKYKQQIESQEKAQEKVSSVSAENKNDKPVVEYFVMSYCPYGTQFEKGIVPALRLLGGKIDAQMKFVSYAMHDKKELDENLSQYCIQKEQNDKFYDYLDCFLASKGKDADATSCIASTGINKEKLTSCIEVSDKEFKVSENYKNKSTWKGQFPSFDTDKADNEKYNIGGSPTFVINGEKISTARDSASLLKAICSGFNDAPEECEKTLSSEVPAPGFGTEKASVSTNNGGCEQ